jgi:formate--tetrahydrofolate ligase
MKTILHVAKKINLRKEQLILFGNYKAKILPGTLQEKEIRKSRLILVTSITPTKSGNGKTTTAIGLADGLNKIGRNAVAALREPSLGPCFGMKGGATGGGKSQLFPADDINLHFNGDFHAVSIANNMLSALLDNYNFHRQGTPDELKELFWKRVMDVNDRSLRYIITGLHGGRNGLPAETGFDITPASELMAILCLAENLADLQHRIDNILLGYTAENKPVTPKSLGISGAITALMKDALLPNLVQTAEGNPAILHGGPFANIAHGCNSVLATKTALQAGDFVLTEAGFGSDLGAEKFFNIKCRSAGLIPDLSLLVVTLKSLKLHGGVAIEHIKQPNAAAIRKGMRNIEKHIKILLSFGQKVLVVLNQFDSDTAEEIALLETLCTKKKLDFAINNAYSKGGEGCIAAAKKIVELTKTKTKSIKYTYELSDSIETKIQKIVTKIYGGKSVSFEKKAKQQLKRIQKAGYHNLPVCIAKTQYSFTDDPQDSSSYSGFEITVDDLIVNAGAGFIVAVCGEIMRMPGLPEEPNALQIRVENGAITGLH